MNEYEKVMGIYLTARSIWMFTVLGVALVLVVSFAGSIVVPWRRARRARVGLSLLRVSMLRVRPPFGTSLEEVVDCLIRCKAAGMDVPIRSVLEHARPGGRIGKVADGLVIARELGLHLDWRHAAAMDLIGRDCLEGARKPGTPVEAPRDYVRLTEQTGSPLRDR